MTRPGTRSALLVGATGLVGRACLDALLGRREYGRVVLLARRAPGIDHDRIDLRVVDFDAPQAIRPVAADDVFFALGTTLARAGSREAFARVDFGYARLVADLALQGGAARFLLVSSVGADAESGTFYLRVKGETEAMIRAKSFRATHIFRPGLLLGDRAESRPMEALARAALPWLNPLLVGGLRRYRAIRADVVAQAMVAAALSDTWGTSIHHHDEMVGLAAGDARPAARGETD